MSLLIVYLLTALLFSFICSLLEMVMLIIAQVYIAVLVKEGKRSGRYLQELIKHNEIAPNQPEPF